ncbi:hypothetical protein EBR21_07135 [bacterium]|nr:hypothetical protein [bacterium]
MRQTRGQELAISELRLMAHALSRRFVWAACAGFAISLLAFLLFSPTNFIGHLVDLVTGHLTLEVRKLPILGVRESDIHNYAKALAQVEHELYFWEVLIWTFSLSTLLVFSMLTYLFWKQGENDKLDHYKRGSQLLYPLIHNKFMRREYRKNPPHEMGIPLALGREKVLIPESLQYRHFAFVGASGYGKSTAIEEVLAHARKHKHKALVVDLNGVFYSKFGRANDRLLSLRDERSLAWDFWHEPVATPKNIAAAIVEEETSGNSFFYKSAREVLSALLRMNNSLNELIEDLDRPQPELKERLRMKGETALKMLGEGTGDQADGVMGTAVLDFGFLKRLASKNGDRLPFSISQWMNDPTDSSWVFLTVDDVGLKESQPLLRVWFELACLAALSRNPLQAKQPHTWLVIDEAKSMGQLPSLPAILDKGRKHNVSVVLGFQAFSQIKKIYGEHDSNAIFQGLQNQFFFRMTDVECARYASDVLGEEEVDAASLGMSYGESDTSLRGSINHARVRRKIVMPEEIRNQKILHAFAKICHHQPVKLSFSPSAYAALNEPFVLSPVNEFTSAMAPEFGVYSASSIRE